MVVEMVGKIVAKCPRCEERAVIFDEKIGRGKCVKCGYQEAPANAEDVIEDGDERRDFLESEIERLEAEIEELEDVMEDLESQKERLVRKLEDLKGKR